MVWYIREKDRQNKKLIHLTFNIQHLTLQYTRWKKHEYRARILLTSKMQCKTASSPELREGWEWVKGWEKRIWEQMTSCCLTHQGVNSRLASKSKSWVKLEKKAKGACCWVCWTVLLCLCVYLSVLFFLSFILSLFLSHPWLLIRYSHPSSVYPCIRSLWPLNDVAMFVCVSGRTTATHS